MFSEKDRELLKLAGEVADLRNQVNQLTEIVEILKHNQVAQVDQANNDRKRARNLAGYAFMMGR